MFSCCGNAHVNFVENPQLKRTSFLNHIHGYLIQTLSDNAFNGNIVNQALPTLHGGSLEITLTYSPCVANQKFKGTVKEKWNGVKVETWETQELIETHQSSNWCSCFGKLIWNRVKVIPKGTYVGFCITFVVLNRSYLTSQRSLRISGLILLLFAFNNFSFLIDIWNIIYASGSCHQNSNQW